ncbi:hypothetical protein TEA_005669 [Camellia sinensis var. sinensis]|uniref:Uncharacterized protein n=1 Tax=Camellia sinensis var. sinensis TaxID=542762 RepID=A0A4S4E4Z3_CAMSN|nr:hypothetical protein TEA_005669 [Camellia sinensis var. sinensis]
MCRVGDEVDGRSMVKRGSNEGDRWSIEAQRGRRGRRGRRTGCVDLDLFDHRLWGACFFYFRSGVGATERGDGGASKLESGSGWEVASEGLGFGSIMLDVLTLVGVESACFPWCCLFNFLFGGGRVIRPGEVLETSENKSAKEEHTRELLAAYKSKVGLSIDPKLKSECKKSELHGLAALQWSICQDSLSRPNEARVMYEKLQSHPNVKVSKKAKQFLFAFQAMEMMKMKSTTLSPINTGYQDYFEAFIEDKANHGLKDAEVEESALNQALPYIIFLASPILVVLLVAAVQKGI